MSILMKTDSQPRYAVIRAITILLIGCLALPGAAFAVGINTSKIPKTKQYAPEPQEKFEARTKEFRNEKPFGDENLSYSLRLPEGWSDGSREGDVPKEGDAELSRSVPDILGRYVSPAKNFARSVITVEAQYLGSEISAQNWFVNLILKSGVSLTGLREISPHEAEALYVQLQGDETSVVRARVLIDGPRVILIRYYLPQENYDEDKAEQAQLLAGFRLLAPSGGRIEKEEQYGFLDQSYFNYPGSWTLKEQSILSIERMGAGLVQETIVKNKTVMSGQIKISLVSRLLNTTLAQEVAAFRQGVKIKDYTIGPMIEEITYNFNPSIKTGKAQVYKLIPNDPVNMKPYEFVVTVMQGDDYYYITSLITTSREEDFFAWARNMEVMRIVNESMRRNNTAADAEPNDPYFDYLKNP